MGQFHGAKKLFKGGGVTDLYVNNNWNIPFNVIF